MSRIIRGRVTPGEAVDGTTLNATYADFTQAGALDGANTRDQALDLPQLKNVPIFIDSQEVLLGNAGMVHTITPTTVASSTSSPVLHSVQNSSGAETFLNFSASPWALATTDILRLWWNLSVSTAYTGSPWDGGSTKGRYTIDDTGGAGGTVQITDGMHCWLVYVEWDITSAGLSNWVPVPGQQAPTGSIGSDTGVQLQHCAASSVISPWAVTSAAAAVEGEMPSGNKGTAIDHGWYGHYGMWAHVPASPVTVYGIRLKITGLMHPAHLSGGNEENALVFDYSIGDASRTLKYTGGRMTALQMKAG